MIRSRYTLLISLISLFALSLAKSLSPRDSLTNRCGPQWGGLSCSSVGTVYRCCSQFSYCGDSNSHCGTGCQQGYGICSGPSSKTTPAIPTPTISFRPRLGNVPYGADIYSCLRSGVVAMTFDDGPWIYTTQLLDILRAQGVKATFFISGNNLEKGAIDTTSEWTNVIARAYREGHQIASHTWDHPNLDSLSEADRRYQMIRLEQAFLKIIERYPTYMRPPYSNCGTMCLSTMYTLGYHVAYFDLDTDDYNQDSPNLIQNSKDIVRTAMDGSNPNDRSFLGISHDIHQQTVINLTNFQIDMARSNGYKLVRLGECMNDPEANWYRTLL